MAKKPKHPAKHHAKKSTHATKSHAKKSAVSAAAKPANIPAGQLIMFHGAECFHCRNMDALVDKLEKEFGVKVTKLEVWHNDANASLLEQADQGMCGGVPFFWNAKTKKWICGETGYDELKDWAGV